MDLTSLKSQETTEIEIKHPVTGEGTGVFITVAGLDSVLFRAARREQLQELINAKSKAIKTEVDFNKAEQDDINLLVKATVGWKGVEEKGKPVEFTPENVARVYFEYAIIKEQVEKAIGDRSLFFVN